MNHGGTTPGNWGNGYLIVTPIKYKRVSCATCVNFDAEDGGCCCTAVVPRVDGYQSWKKCKKFELSPEYLDSEHKNQVLQVKGKLYPSDVKLKSEEIIEPIPCIAPVNVERQSVSAEVKTLRVLEKLYKADLEIKDLGKDGLVGIENLSQGISVVFIKKFPSKTTTEYNRWKPKCINLIANASRYLKNKDAAQKLVIMPICKLDNGDTLAEEYYHKHGGTYRHIFFVEIGKDGELLIASGPVEKYWTKDKINKVKIFKEQGEHK